MDRGLYTAASNGLVSARRLEIVSNNLANINTVGFKAQKLVTRQQEFSDTLASKIEGVSERAALDHQQAPGAINVGTFTDFDPGPVSQTGNPLNVQGWEEWEMDEDLKVIASKGWFDAEDYVRQAAG